MSSSISLCIGLVEKVPGMSLDGCNIEVLSFKFFPVVLEIALKNLRLVVIGSVVYDCIFVIVSNGRQIEDGLLVLEKELDLIESAKGEHKFLLVFVF